MTDKKWARENVKDSKHLLDDLEHHRFKHALKKVDLMDEKLHGIRREIRSGKARRESS